MRLICTSPISMVFVMVYAIRGLISKPHIGQTIRVITIVGDLKKNSDINKTKRFVWQMTPWLSG